MDTRLLRMFCAVAKQGSVVAASRQLHLTSSAISHGLKALETHLGCRLFDRVGKRIHVNHFGEQLLAQIEGPLAALATAAENLQRLSKWGQTRLRLVASASACQYILPSVIRGLTKSFPNVSLQVDSADMTEALELLRHNRIDLALGNAPDNKAGLDVRRVFRDELLFAFAPAHPWATAHTLTTEDIAAQPLILYQRTSLTARLVSEYFRCHDIHPRTVMEVANIEAIKELAKLNLGVAVLAPWNADDALVRGKLLMRPLGREPLRRDWAVVCLAGRRWSLAEEQFCRLCRATCSGMRADRRDLPKR